jgi:3-hydroxyphenylacetate 6-hydroxylase
MYTIYLRLLSAFEIRDVHAIDGGVMNTHPVRGVEDPTQLVSVPKRYTVRLVPRDEAGLRKALAAYVDEKH